ncbi:MAG: sigma-70 family RNA polymerase sigma factor [Clostridia bacterium]|nr:sigma-70 family RNA polymerase sigma factor [Clostridia bacterium]
MKLTSPQQALAENNLGLAHACANRFRGRGVEYEDLFQAGCVGLVKAAGGFDETLGYQFSTYAVPVILGEIKRVFRDGGSVKIGRAAKEKAMKLKKTQEELTGRLAREPSVSELAADAGMDVCETAILLSAGMPTVSLSREEDTDTDIPVPPPDEGVTARMDLARALKKLTDRERELLRLRYEKGLTQTVTAQMLGMTQVQVSRREKQILLKLRGMME